MIDYKYLRSLIWYVPLELANSSYIYTAICTFCKQKNIEFKVSNKNYNNKGRLNIINQKIIYEPNWWYAKVTYVELLLFDNKRILLAFDLHDSNSFFPTEALKKADIVYKRSYQQKLIDCLPDEYKRKLRPMGLPFMIRPEKIFFRYRVLCLFVFFKFKELIKFDRFLFKRIKLLYKQSNNQWINFINARTDLDFYNYNNKDLNDQIFYQKRLFPNENDKDTKDVHSQRVSIISLLKANFPLKFKGGLKDDMISRRLYPNLISNIDGNPKQFLKIMRNCGICIYTRGLLNSTGWTLSEFLSQGKCIIAEKLDIEFPEPLKNNFHLIYFSSNDELIEICQKLINNKSEMRRLAKNARDYYEKYINPLAFIENIFKDIK